jgi:hypothetical protein
MVPKVRPARFVQHLIDLVRADPQPTAAWTFAECGYTQTAHGLVLGLPTRALVYWQACGALGPGERFENAEQPVRGMPPPPMSMPQLPAMATTAMVTVERYVGALLTGAQDKETSAVSLYADRPIGRGVPYGLNVHFHSGAKVFLYARHCVPAGGQIMPGEDAFRRRDGV